jgi:hypothetical protein
MKARLPRLLLLAAASSLPAGEAPRYDVHPLRLEGAVEKIVAADMDGDGLADLICVQPGEMHVLFQRRDWGFDPAAPGARLELPEGLVAWDVARLTGAGRPQVLALLDGTEVKTWSLDPVTRRFAEGRSVAPRLSALLPRGFYHLPFARDLDGRGEAELVIPVPGAVQLLAPDGERYQPGPSLVSEAQLRLALDTGGDLAAPLGQSVAIPWFQVRDVNGDGYADLISETGERIEVYLALGRGQFPRNPSYAIDLAALKAELKAEYPDDVDLTNLTAALGRTVQALLKDIDGDGAEDVIVRAGGKVSVYRGGRSGADLASPHQVLKASGNVVAAMLEDEDGDGRPDLWLVRVAAVSVADLLLWLIASGSIDVDVFIYRAEEGRFGRRPARRLAVKVLFPSLLSLIERARQVDRELRERSLPACATADLAGRGVRRDVVVVEEGRLRGYFLKARPQEPSCRGEVLMTVLRRCGYSRERDAYTVDLNRLEDLLSVPETELLQAVEGRQPDLELELEGAAARPALHVIDLNGDGRDDFLLFYERTGEGLHGAVVMSRGR